MRMPVGQVKAAPKDPHLHAAVAGQRHLLAKVETDLAAACGEQFRRIGENMAATIRMDLIHIDPRYEGGGREMTNLEPLCPWEHAFVDEHRFSTGPRP